MIHEPSWSWTRVGSPSFCSTSISGRRGTKPTSWSGSSWSLAQSQLLVELAKSLKVTHGLMMSRTASPPVLERGLEQRDQLLLVAGERPRDERGAAGDRLQAEVERRDRVLLAGLAAEVGVEVGGRRELALGQAVAAVVLDDVDERQVAAADVLELADADVGRVAVAADADAQELAVGEQRAGGHRGHPAVERVEAVAVLEEVGGGLARTADPAELDGLVRVDPDRLARLDQVAGDAVVAAPLAEGRGEALEGQGRQGEGVAVVPDGDRRFADACIISADLSQRWRYCRSLQHAERGSIGSTR